MSYNNIKFRSSRWDQVFTTLVETDMFPKVLNRALIYGFSRTGKSTLAHTLLNSERITFHSGMPLDDLIGGWTLKDGKTVWADGPAVRALRNGSCLQIDEINEIPLECKTVLYALMDNPAGITLPSGERIEAAPGYSVVGTMNPAPNVLPEPVYERFDIILRADELSAGTRDALGQFVEPAMRTVGRGSSYTWTRPMSVGLCLAANQLVKAGLSGDAMATALGLTGPTVTDFLAAVTE
jgi:AAA domain (dynein-related subfamily)